MQWCEPVGGGVLGIHKRDSSIIWDADNYTQILFWNIRLEYLRMCVSMSLKVKFIHIILFHNKCQQYTLDVYLYTCGPSLRMYVCVSSPSAHKSNLLPCMCFHPCCANLSN